MSSAECQTTLPADVCQAAGLKASDQVEWRFEEGEIRGRKVQPAPEPQRIVATLVQRGDALIFEAPGVSMAPEAIPEALREERNTE
jgi:hypothetical protein